MQYDTEISVRSNEHAVLSEAAKLLMSCGFNLSRQNDNEVVLTGPGMRSTNQNPILGATEISLRHSHASRGKLAVHADLGGVRWMRGFITWFLPLLFGGLMTFFTIIFAVIAQFVPRPMPPGLLVNMAGGGLLLLFPFLVIGPFAIRWIRRRTEFAIDACISNADELVRLEHGRIN
jgi:hypothetical protein